MAKLTLKELKDQKSKANRNKAKRTKKHTKPTESNSTPKSRRGAKKDQDKPKKNSTPKEDLKISRGGPPHPPLPGTRWVKGSDGKYMMHEINDPDLRRYRA